MFAKISLESFRYKIKETFFFPNKKTKEIYDKYMIAQVFPYSVLTDTDICVFFIFICKPESRLLDLKFRDVPFEVIVENEISHKFDTPHKFWENYSTRNKLLKKKLGYFIIENIDKLCVATVAVNRKEYHKSFKSQNVIKNTKA